MKVLLLLALPIGVWSSAPHGQRLRRGLTVESLEVEMQLETMTAAEKKQQIHKALGHHHDASLESNVEVLETVLETGQYPKPERDGTPKTTEELIQHYLDTEPAGGGHSFLSKGGTAGSLNQPGTLGVHGGGGGGTTLSNEKKSKSSEEEDDDDDEDGPPRKNDQKTGTESVPTAPPSISPTSTDGTWIISLSVFVTNIPP